MDRILTAAGTLAVALSVSLPAVAQSHGFEGLWGLSGSQCDARGDSVPTEITATAIHFYESSCAIADVKSVGEAGTTWRVEAECSGEGEQWTVEYLMATIADSQPQTLVMIEMDYGAAWLMERCG